jgi:hypothetical protein
MVNIADNAKQWRGIGPFIQTLPSWLSQYDATRIEAYRIYEEMYWNTAETFKLTFRGSNDAPIYLPSARTIIDACNRFLAVDWNYAIDPRVGTPEDQTMVDTMLRNLFRRELVYSKFGTQKRYGLIRGDAVWHVVADPLKLPGRRVSMYEVDPSSYFPIYLDDNVDKLVGVHLADQVPNPADATKVVVRRQTYRKDPATGVITTEMAYFELGKWDDREIGAETSLVAQVVPPTLLDPRITSIPVYHVKNMRTPGQGFGSSELRGFESLFAAVNQSISDQDMTLALQGLGIYATTSGPPVDNDGNETNWRIGPGRVVELEPDATFTRVNGVQTVIPSLDHIKFVRDSTYQAAGVSDIAAGKVDVSIAESGISLQMQLAPMLAKNADKEQEMLSVLDHMLYDLVQMWFPVYEALPSGIAVEAVNIVGDPLPVDRAAFVKETLDLLTANVISAEYARERLATVGYAFPENMGEAIVTEQKALSEAQYGSDPFNLRVQSEILDAAAEGGAA